MRLLCIANPPAYEKAATDVPLSYARLAAHPEVELFHADTEAMMRSGEMIGAVRVEAGFKAGDFGALGKQEVRRFPPGAFDLAFCRTLKPFPAGYLDRLVEWSRQFPFLNNPAAIQKQLDPAFLLLAASHFLPPTLFTREEAAVEQFLGHHQTIVAKRPNSCGGRGVYKIAREEQGRLATDNIVEGPKRFESFSDLFAQLTDHGTDPVLLMRYLRRVSQGDKRIVAVDGQIYGSYLRRSVTGHWVQNVSFGARCERVPVSAEERELVAATCSVYLEAGIHLLGYDLLQDDDATWKISEINAGNVGGLFRLECLGEEGITDRFVGWLKSFPGRVGRNPG